jgi:beta-galactosidase
MTLLVEGASHMPIPIRGGPGDSSARPSRLFLPALFIALFIASGQAQTTQPAAPRPRIERLAQPPDLMISVWYNGGKARAPMLSPITPSSREEWLRDLQQIKALGFNTVRGWVDWSHNEPREGQYHFENLQLLCGLARQVGLRVVIQIYTGWDGFGFPPDWVRHKYPDGFPPVSAVSATGPSTFYSDHKGIRDAILRFITEAAKVAVQYPNFYGWDLWSEPQGMRLIGPDTKVRYRDWLKNKYQTLDALNLQWYETYASWDDVNPLGTGGIGTYAMDLDWDRFIAEKGAEDMAMQYLAVRKADKTHLITSHASPPSIFGGGLDDFLEAESLDYYGLSVYPRYAGEPSLWRMLLGADFSRCANKPNGGFYAGEFQGGFSTNGITVGDPVTPADQRTWLWSLIAKGAKGINIYAYYAMSSGIESGGFGLMPLNGQVTDRAKELGQTARFIEENKALILKSKPVDAEIAIVYNPDAPRVGGARGAPATTPGQGRGGVNYQESLTGYYRAFTENNVPIDFIHVRDLEAANLAHYKLILLPWPVILSPEAAAGIKTYVAQGGSLVSEARLAWNSEHAYTADVIPGMGLSEVFGIAETKVVTRTDVRMILDAGRELRGSQFAESVELLPAGAARVLAYLEDGTPCVTTSTYGKGQTMFIGSFLSFGSRINSPFLLNLLDWAKVSRPFKTSQDGLDPDTPLEARLHQNAGGYLLYLINHGAAAKPVTVNLNLSDDGQFSLTEIVHQQLVQSRSQNKVLTFSADLPAKQVALWDIRRQ